MSGKYRMILAFWGALFLASILMLFVNLRSLEGGDTAVLPQFPENGLELENGESLGRPGELPGNDSEMQWSLILSTVSALISAAGFMATTYFALRSDRRQSALNELQVKKLAGEIERQRLEIDRLRKAEQDHEKEQGA